MHVRGDGTRTHIARIAGVDVSLITTKIGNYVELNEDPATLAHVTWLWSGSVFLIPEYQSEFWDAVRMALALQGYAP